MYWSAKPVTQVQFLAAPPSREPLGLFRVGGDAGSNPAEASASSSSGKDTSVPSG